MAQQLPAQQLNNLVIDGAMAKRMAWRLNG
jgi:hypothetical protein